jgi:hypothetical protein
MLQIFYPHRSFSPEPTATVHREGMSIMNLVPIFDRNAVAVGSGLNDDFFGTGFAGGTAGPTLRFLSPFSACKSLRDKSLYAGRNNRNSCAEKGDKPMWADTRTIVIIGRFAHIPSHERFK